jgi:hypothetical protein
VTGQPSLHKSSTQFSTLACPPGRELTSRHRPCLRGRLDDPRDGARRRRPFASRRLQLRAKRILFLTSHGFFSSDLQRAPSNITRTNLLMDKTNASGRSKAKGPVRLANTMCRLSLPDRRCRSPQSCPPLLRSLFHFFALSFFAPLLVLHRPRTDLCLFTWRTVIDSLSLRVTFRAPFGKRLLRDLGSEPGLRT